MKKPLYILIGIIYLSGLFFLVDFLFNFQNKTFGNHYLTLLFPFLSLFILGLYLSFTKVFNNTKSFKLCIEKKNIKYFLLPLLIIIALSSLSINQHFNPYHSITFLTICGYVIALITGYRLINFVNNHTFK